MLKIRFTALITFLSILLCSCGSSYSVPRATLHVDLAEASQLDGIISSISTFLSSNGFRDMGQDEEILALLEWSSKRHEGEDIARSNDDEIDLIHRTNRLKNESMDVDVTMIDYSDTTIKKRFANYPASETEITDAPSLEINIYNYRPGGFSPEAHRFYSKFHAFIETGNPGRVHTVFSPPETDQAEFYKTRAVNLLGGALWWLLVYSISISLFGFVLIWLLNRTRLGITYRRAVFVLLGTALATPLPFPAATLFVIILPSVLALPAIGSGYFSRIQDFAIPSFIVSCVFCILISAWLIRRKQSDPSRPEETRVRT